MNRTRTPFGATTVLLTFCVAIASTFSSEPRGDASTRPQPGPGGVASTDVAFDAPGNFNPLVPGYFADPTIRQFGDTFYLYATTDGNGGGRGPATVWLSKDFVNWVLAPMNWPTAPVYWAPDVIRRPDGKYYLFYNQPCRTFAGVADSPLGPWKPIASDDGLVIPDRLVKDVITLDTQLFEDRDGTLYGYWGTWGIYPNSGCGYGVFNPDLKSFARLGMIPNTQAKDFFEAPFLIERNGVYYFTYSSGSCHDATYRVQYAVGTRPDGEFKMGPNNPILATTPDGKIHGPGHHSILQRGDEYFIVYHRHDIPVTPNGMHRQTCADRLIFERDGEIRRVAPTHAGIGYLGPKARPANLARGAKVTASSSYQDTLRRHEFKPEYAVDDNNATLWRPADNGPGHWLMVDFGAAQRVRRTEIQFEYGTWAYQYLLEFSSDGQTWQPFADRRGNTRWGSPMVDEADVTARFLRLTVTGTEYPGLFGSVWNFKAFAEAPSDPLLALADQAFANFVVPGQVALRGQAAANAAGGEARVTGTVPLRSGSERPPAPLLRWDVADLALGSPVAAWTNQGTLGGRLLSGDARPVVGLAAGRKALRFSGREILTASFATPRALAGNSSFTVAAWVNNPEIGESECYLSWAGRGGPDATTAQFGYGTQAAWGAVGHWGFADMAFRGGPPQAGQWHHLATVFDGVVERLYVDGRLVQSAAKMLMMHEGRPLYVGASEPGTEPFDGYLASLRVYAAALPEAEVKRLAAEAPGAEVMVYLDSAKLDDGPLEAWCNQGALGGAFTRGEKPPAVADVQGRIAVELGAGRSLVLPLDPPLPAGDFTLLASVNVRTPGDSEGPIELEDGEGQRVALLPAATLGTWHELAVVHRGQGPSRVAFLDGVASPLSAAPALAGLKRIRLGGGNRFVGALSRVQLFRRALSEDEIRQLAQRAKDERRPLVPDPAAWVQPPAPLSASVIAMAARAGQSEAGGVEYRFTEITGHPGGRSSGWTPHRFFLDDRLVPNTSYAYTVRLRDAVGNVTVASPFADASTEAARLVQLEDAFGARHDFLTQGTRGSIWDGFLGQADDSRPELIAAQDGGLRLQSKGTVWDGGKPLGAFLFKLVSGDFVAEATVADYAGWANRKVPGNNDGGLMVRVPPAAGTGRARERFVQLNFFPIWNQGNMVSVVDRGRQQTGNGLAWNAHRHLRILRQGGLFHFQTSADGEQWHAMRGSPVELGGLAGGPLQVGLYHASYGGESSFIAFSRFRLSTGK